MEDREKKRKATQQTLFEKYRQKIEKIFEKETHTIETILQQIRVLVTRSDC